MKNRIFKIKKVDLKSQAIQAWKAGQKVSVIATDLQVSRETIYRWLEEFENRLSVKKARRKKDWDENLCHRLLELYVVLRAPSVRVLRAALYKHFQISLTATQVRGLLKRLELNRWKPSAQWEYLMKAQVQSEFSLRKQLGTERETESLRKSLAHFLPPKREDPRDEGADTFA